MSRLVDPLRIACGAATARLVWLCAALTGCSGGDGTSVDAPPGVFSLSSPSLANNAGFDPANTCDGADSSPELVFANNPVDAGSLAVILVDHSVQPAGLVHWVLYDIPPTATGLPAGVAAGYEPANVAGAHQSIGLNGDRQYHGPCPPALHTYSFDVYALPEPTLPGATMDTTKEDAAENITAHQGAHATLTGTYQH